MSRILVAEDDEFFAHALKTILEDYGHEATLAANGKIAIEILQSKEFDCILTDLQMPQMGGMQLAAWVKEHKKIPLIMVTGFAESIDTEKALAGGAVNLIFKPFADDEITQALKHALNTSNSEKSVELESKYVKVPGTILVLGGVAEFNLYRKFEGKLTKLVSRGEFFDPVLSKIQNSANLYTEKENLSKILPIGTMVAKASLKSTQISAARRAQIIEDMIAIMYARVENLGLDHESLNGPVEVMKCLTTSISDDAIWVLLDNLQKDGELLFAHTMAVTTLTLLVAIKRGMSITEQFKLGASCLLHDIGELNMDPKLTRTSPLLLSIAEREKLHEHVELGVAMLTKCGSIPEEISTIIMQHHEESHGKGYPKHLQEIQIHPLAKILRAVDEFVMAVIKIPGARVQEPLHALKSLHENKGLDIVTIRDLEQILSTRKRKTSA